MHLSFLHVLPWLDSSFLFIAKLYSIVCMYNSLFIHSLTDRHLGFFHVLTIMHKDAINICVLVFV